MRESSYPTDLNAALNVDKVSSFVMGRHEPNERGQTCHAQEVTRAEANSVAKFGTRKCHDFWRGDGGQKQLRYPQALIPIDKYVLCAHMCDMNTLTLALSNSAYKKAEQLAKSHGVPVVAYLATEVEDLLDAKSVITGNYAESGVISPLPLTRSPQPNFSSEEPDTLKQVLLVLNEVYRTGIVQDEELARRKYRDSVRTVATGLGILETTVRDKCSTDRRLGLPGVRISTDWFVAMICKPEELLEHLVHKFPPFEHHIRRSFAKLLPDRFRQNDS
jgi:hypothetical protein